MGVRMHISVHANGCGATCIKVCECVGVFVCEGRPVNLCVRVFI